MVTSATTYAIIGTMKSPITQSKAWYQLQQDLGETSFYEQGSGYHYLAILKHTPVGNYLYLPYGPVFKDKSGMENALKSLRNLAQRHQAIFARVEPQSREFIEHLPHSAKKSPDLSPQDTWVLDLTPDKPTIITNFSQGTRTRYNTYSKKGLVVEATKDSSAITHLVKLQDALYKAKHLSAFSEFYLRTELEQPFATLYLVRYQRPADVEDDQALPADGQILAASLFFDHGGTRYYMQSAADNTYKKLPATVALLTQAIFDAKEQGIKLFDFWGIAPDNASPSHPWYGFTKFKKSFGGHEVNYSGTYDLIYNSPKYRIYQVLRKLNRIIRKNQ